MIDNTGGDRGRGPQSERIGGPALSLEVISDAICPWCWIGKHRLDRAIAALAPEIDVEVTWRPFELNPDMPKAGVDRRSYRERKFGSWENSQALDARVVESARGDGLAFRYDLMSRTPNTRDAHRLIGLAGREGVQSAVVEALFVAYFNQGRDTGDHAVLIDVGAAVSLDPAMVEAMLNSDEGEAELTAQLQRAYELDILAVPTVLAGGRPIFSGAIASEMMEARLRLIAAGEGGV